MKKYLLLLTASLSLTVARGQTNVYHPFPSDSTFWLYHSSSPFGNDYDFFVQWLGDTVINSTTYKKEFKSGFTTQTWTYSGGIRQDFLNEKIYKIDNAGVEHDVTVSRHLIVGDTLPIFSFGFPFPNDSFIINSIDSVQIGSKFHKRYNAYQPTLGSYVVGLGIQSVYHSNPPQSIGLICFSVDNVSLYGSAPPCQLVSNNEFSIPDNQVSVSPNPFSAQTALQTATPLKKASLTICNSVGQTVKHIDNLSGQTVIFQRDNLPSGLYFVRLTQDGNTISVDKFVITDR